MGVAMVGVVQGFINVPSKVTTQPLTTTQAAKLTDLSPFPSQTQSTFTDKLFLRAFLPPHVYRDTVRYEVKKGEVSL